MPKHNLAPMQRETGIQLADSTISALASLGSMWAKVDAARARSLPTYGRPDNSFTVEEYAQQYGMTNDAARSQLRRMANAGVFVAHRVIDVAIDGRNCVMNVYTVAQ